MQRPTTSLTLSTKGRVGRKLEDLGPMRGQAKRSPDPRNHGLAHPHPLRHGARRPVRGALGLGLKGERDQVLDLVVSDLARSPGAGPVNKAVEPMLQEALAPGGHARPTDPELARHARIRCAHLGAGQHDTGALDKSLAGAASANQSLERGPFLRAQGDRSWLRSAGHGCLPQGDRNSLNLIGPQCKNNSNSDH